MPTRLHREAPARCRCDSDHSDAGHPRRFGPRSVSTEFALVGAGTTLPRRSWTCISHIRDDGGRKTSAVAPITRITHATLRDRGQFPGRCLLFESAPRETVLAPCLERRLEGPPLCNSGFGQPEPDESLVR